MTKTASGSSAAAGAILCFGEMLLRLSPNQNELLLQSPALTVRPGGAEANVAVSLARFGAPTRMATVLPDNALGHAARDEVRKHGVDTTHIVFTPGRMGLYFLTPGAVRRPSEVLYDRAGSAFVEHVDTAFDWDRLLDGVEWLHASGVTPATGPNGSAAAVAIIEAAVRKGAAVEAGQADVEQHHLVFLLAQRVLALQAVQCPVDGKAGHAKAALHAAAEHDVVFDQ